MIPFELFFCIGKATLFDAGLIHYFNCCFLTEYFGILAALYGTLRDCCRYRGDAETFKL